MANKFLISGATYCGDGTTSSEAASAGAAGAWNDLNVLTGTAPAYGSLAAGDVVYIRSKTSAGADPTITHDAASINIGSSSATAASPIMWVLDGGTIWSGIAGTLTISSTGAYSVTPRDHNHFTGYATDTLVFTNTKADLNGVIVFVLNAAQVINALFDYSYGTANAGATINWFGNSNGRNRLINCHFKLKRIYNNSVGNANSCVLIDCDFEILSGWACTTTMFCLAQYQSELKIIGGQIRSAVALTGLRIFNGSSAGGGLVTIGFVIPAECLVESSFSGLGSFGFLTLAAVDGLVGAIAWQKAGSVDSRDDGNYPTLNAVLPDSGNTPWSYKLYPQNATASNPLLLSVAKLYTSSAAAKVVTLELLVGTTFSAINTATCYAVVSYVDDTTGVRKSVVTRHHAAGALTTSSASWSATTYGAVSFDKKKLAITTPTSIKQDTLVIVTLFAEAIADTTAKLLFVDPDIQLATP